ncbi:MAG: L-rhamnose mutarotase [Planctomycetes bacterium]|nr:L-rhamnose mutarotase [Planctomycetota bacterium]
MAARLAFTLELKPETVSKYIEHHRHVWPEVQKSLRENGFYPMSIFLLGHRLFLYTEYHGHKPVEQAFEDYLRPPKCQEWDALMRTFQKPVSEAKPGEWWAPMQEVYRHE